MLNLPVRVPDGGDGGAPGLADHTGSPVVQEPAASQPPPPRRPAPPLPPAPMLAPPAPERQSMLPQQRASDLEHMVVPNTEPAPESSLRPPGGAPELAADPPPTQPATTAPPGGAQGPAAHRQPPMGEENSYNTAPEGGAQGPAVNSQPPITTAPPGGAQGPALADGQWQQPPNAQRAGQQTWEQNWQGWHWQSEGAGW
jgi:hypothetical protein